uniref:Uncharacterized protein n=1 Tax=Romanomermis culicivorax TaxID=13658 RepID=A0A915J349_ROMCU
MSAPISMPSKRSVASDNGDWKRSNKRQIDQIGIPSIIKEQFLKTFRRLPCTLHIYTVNMDISIESACELLTTDPILPNVLAIHCLEYNASCNEEIVKEEGEENDHIDSDQDGTEIKRTKH